MSEVSEKKITTQEDAIRLANKIARYAVSKNFKPFAFTADFEERRTTPQNDYYWAGVVQRQYDYFKNDLIRFVEWLFKAARHNLTTELIHEINKILYNNGQSTTKISKDSYVEVFIKPLRDDMLHLCSLTIDLPPGDFNRGEE